jgi:hypothetical protein
MTNSELLDFGYLIIATIAAGKYADRSWPTNNRSFALAVDERQQKKSPLVSQFYVADGVAGRWSVDFDYMLSLLHAAGVIGYDSQTFRSFQLRIGFPFVKRTLAKHAPRTLRDAEEFVAAWAAASE